MAHRFAWVLVGALALGGCAQNSLTSAANAQRAAHLQAQIALHAWSVGDSQEAQMRLDEAQRLDPQQPLIWAVSGLIQEEHGQLVLASENLKKAYGLAQGDGKILNIYGTFLCRQGEFAQAEAMFQLGLNDTAYATPEMLWTNAGICARETGDIERARSYFGEALKLRDDYRPALQELSRLETDYGH
ncbi:type IV pilus assembly protein PilF [Ectothiorhodosinus mongolicus]|uniref:Type IV pilus assembly protein PilF n=1 Tax=Ectothiorhodosinus mongolicus TaxID=233100 RepID=A0A1R3W800_9GAMM|nr:hypothetical protein [Ectothiorhodosinus mongolicus]ULX57662.1 hypothetical protein CKX93_08345 [Ectothiorhodosinus mongolicus]SIT73849.1 type IV pilus assembly protein PilF [Ectothiorhodosinus mongolicus]